ncbi:MAG: zinc ribbon domain-containing protein [Candidatus Bathyarchaeota archaeon]|nr:zinc ribbon domain-containing protein [Candidatus Bathyarchaeota archaeon]
MGILDKMRKMRERNIARRKEKEMRKREEAWTKTLEWLNKEYNRGLKKIAKTPIEFSVSQKGILSRIEMKSGVHIASFTSLVPYMGQVKESAPLVPLTCICGAYVEKPIPSSMFVKQVRVGLLKESFFLPYAAMPKFSAKRVYKEKSNWNPLLERLNQDKKLRGLLKDLPTETKVAISVEKDLWGNPRRTTYQVFKVDDKDDNYNTVCQVIPFKDKSLVTTRHMMEKPKRIEHAVKAISRIREHIIDHGYDQPTTGQIPQPWASSIVVFLARAPAPASSDNCPSCGASLSSGAFFCPSCGKKVK